MAVIFTVRAGKTAITLGGEGASSAVAVHNMAAGVADNDGVNVAQLNERLRDSGTQVLNQANSYTDARINDVWQDLGDEINQVNKQANKGIAATSALINVTPYLPGRTAINAGVAGYRGEAVARSRRIDQLAVLVVPEHQRVERSRSACVAADDELLPSVHAHLHPRA